MRYHTEKPERPVLCIYGEVYRCDHPVYNSCTLFRIGKKGLAVIQQRFDAANKHTFWGATDQWLAGAIYLNPGFQAYFEGRAGEPEPNSGIPLYPTVTVRQIMWALRMKPLRKERWETAFDRKDI